MKGYCNRELLPSPCKEQDPTYNWGLCFIHLGAMPGFCSSQCAHPGMAGSWPWCQRQMGPWQQQGPCLSRPGAAPGSYHHQPVCLGENLEMPANSSFWKSPDGNHVAGEPERRLDTEGPSGFKSKRAKDHKPPERGVHGLLEESSACLAEAQKKTRSATNLCPSLGQTTNDYSKLVKGNQWRRASNATHQCWAQDMADKPLHVGSSCKASLGTWVLSRWASDGSASQKDHIK